MGDGNGTGHGSSISQIFEKHWSALSPSDRLVLLNDLGVDGKNEEILGGKTIDQIVQSDQDGLPGIVRIRLVNALTEDGFSKKEYERVREETRRTREEMLESGLKLTSSILEHGN